MPVDEPRDSIRKAVLAALHASGLADVETTRPGDAHPEPSCSSCGLPFRFPGVAFHDQVCTICRHFERNRRRVETYFASLPELLELLKPDRTRPRHQTFDCILLLSGGKNSTYALHKLRELGVSVVTLTVTTPDIDDRAVALIERVTTSLGVPHRVLQPKGSSCHANPFADWIEAARDWAHQEGVPRVVTGLSRGRIVQDRLLWFHARNIFDPAVIDSMLASRKALGTMVDDCPVGGVPVVIDFFRYCPDKEESIVRFLEEAGLGPHPLDPAAACTSAEDREGAIAWDVRLGHRRRDRGAPAAPGSGGHEAVPLRARDGTTDRQVQALLDEHTPGWRDHLRLVYRGRHLSSGHDRMGPSHANTPLAVQACVDAWTFREHALVAFSSDISYHQAQLIVWSVLPRFSPAVEVVGQPQGRAALLRSVAASRADHDHMMHIARILIAADEERAGRDREAPSASFSAILIHQAKSPGPWVLLSAPACSTRWSTWRHLVSELGRAAGIVAGTVPGTPPVRPARQLTGTQPTAAASTVQPLPRTSTVWGDPLAIPHGAPAPRVLEWIDYEDRRIVMPGKDDDEDADGSLGIGVRLVGEGEAVLQPTTELEILIDPAGRWLSSVASTQVVVETSARDSRVRVHHSLPPNLVEPLLQDHAFRQRLVAAGQRRSQ